MKRIFLFLASVSTLSSFGQLCTGSLGLPIVNTTFGSGTNPGLPLPLTNTTYQYVSNDCPPDGFYTIRNNTSNCFPPTWHTLNTDHTGDANGYFMLINASIQPGAFYIDTVRGLCSGTTFEFAAWAVNVMRPTACGNNGIRPNLTFIIENTNGTVIQTYSTGDIPAQSNPVWQQYGFFFATPAGVTEVVLRVVNNAPGGCGNDLAIDDITFRPCGPLISSLINGTATKNITICEGQTQNVELSSTLTSGYTNPQFQWQENINGAGFTDIPGATASAFTKSFTSAVPGNYRYRLVAGEAANFNNSGCRILSDELTIIVANNPITSATSNSPLCENSVLQLSATGGNQYSWTGPANFTASGNAVSISNAIPSMSGKYYVSVVNTSGCGKIDSTEVLINPSPVANVLAPSIITCSNTSVQLQATGGGTYEWQPSNGLSSANIANPVALLQTSQQYRVIVKNTFNCADTATSEVIVLQKPTAIAGPDKEAVLGFPVTLEGLVGGDDITFTWTPDLYLSSNIEEQPLVTAPVGNYTYELEVISNSGCGTATDKVNVTVYKGLYIPTAFTPNNDGKNDVWRIPALTFMKDYKLSLFNRYGEQILFSKDKPFVWDGNFKGIPQPAGVYVYMLEVKQDGENRLYKGNLVLIR